jgi:hypothetical protein
VADERNRCEAQIHGKAMPVTLTTEAAAEHSGHGRSCCRLDPVVIDPKRAMVQLQRGLRLAKLAGRSSYAFA